MKSGNSISPSATAGLEEVQLHGMSSTNAPPKSLQQGQRGCQGAENVSASRDLHNLIRELRILEQVLKIKRYIKLLNRLTITVCSAELVLSVLLFTFGIFCTTRTHDHCHLSSVSWTIIAFWNAITGLRTRNYCTHLVSNIIMLLVLAILALLSVVEWDFLDNSCRMCLPEIKIVNNLEFVLKITLGFLFLVSILSNLVFLGFIKLQIRYISVLYPEIREAI